MNFKTSIAMCTYNGSKYINEQLISIISQTVKPDEIIIFDDNSSDETIEVINNTLRNTKIKYRIFQNEINLGVTKNFEQAILNCAGDIIFTSDQDDYWLPNKIEEILKVFTFNSEIKLVFSDAYLADKNLNIMETRLWETLNFKNEDFNAKDFFHLLLRKNVVTGATMAFKRDAIPKLLPISKYWVHDYWIAILSSINAEIKAIDLPLIMYRQHDKNVIGANSKNIILKLKDNIGNIKLSYEFTYQKFQMFNELLNFIKLSEIIIFNSDFIVLIKNSCYFWEDCLIFFDKNTNLIKKIKLYALKVIKCDFFTYNCGFSNTFNFFVSIFL